MSTEVELRVTADLDQARKEVAGFSKEYAALVGQIEKPLRQVNLARDLEKGLEATGKQVAQAKTRLSELQRELINTDYPTERLKESFKEAKKELEQLVRTEAIQANQLARLRGELKGAGVDTTRMAAEQRRLNQEMASALGAGRNEAATRGIRERAVALKQQTLAQRQANLEAARQDLGVSRYRQLQAELVRVRSQYQLLRSAGNLTGRELAIAQRSMTERVRETQRALREMNAEQRRSSGIPGAASGIGGAVGVVGGGYAAVSAISSVTQAADAYNLMNARLRLATESQEEFNTAQSELRRIADDTEAPLASLVTLYGRISMPLRQAGRSQQDILRLTEAVAASFRVSGASAIEAEQGVIQFAQALGAGALRGDEFNSVAEQAPRLMRALADGIGVPVTALKEMAAQGELTASVVTEALSSQLDVLRSEMATLPETASGAAAQLSDAWREGMGNADIQPMIDSIKALKEQVRDPATADGIANISSAIVRVGSVAITSAASLGDLGKQLGVWLAKANDSITRMDEIDNEIKSIESELNGWSLGSWLVKMLYSDDELKAKLERLKQERAKLVEEQTGMNAEMQAAAEKAAADAKDLRQKELDDYSGYVTALDGRRKEEVKAAEAAAKNLVSAEKKALGEIEKVRADRLKIEQRYQEALSGLNSGGEPSYGAAQALKAGARQALAANDVEGAQRQAQAALKMLQDLAAAGENTYGFSGFIQELEAIELAANDIEQTNAEDKLKSIREEIKSLEEQAKNLKEMPVSVKTDEASIEAVRTQIEGLAQQLGRTEITLPVRVAFPNPGQADSDGYVYVPNNPAPPAFARGGILRGRGTGTSDSNLAWLSNGEGILNARAVQHYGADLVHRLNRLSLPRYSTGGVHGGGPSLPPIPQLAPALQQQLDGPNFPDLGRMVLEMGGQSYTVYAPSDQASELKLAARKFGRTSPR